MEQLLLSQLRMCLVCNVIIFVERFDCDNLPYTDTLFDGHSFDIPSHLLDSPVLTVTPEGKSLRISLGSAT